VTELKACIAVSYLIGALAMAAQAVMASLLLGG
jgi:hypothetical protein